MKLLKNNNIYKILRDASKRYRDRRNKNPSFIRLYRKKINRYLEKYFLSKKMLKTTPVFVYQMGKVGSLSIYESLENQYIGAVGHAHTHIDEPDNWRSYMFYKWLKSGRQIKIISPVREPIGRNVSAFFHHVSGAGNTEDKSHLPVDELLHLFLDNPERCGERFAFLDHDLPLTWFDRQMKDVVGIDVYEYDFPESGIATYRKENIALLVLRIDVDDREKEKAIADFLDLPGFVLENTNVAQDKDYSGLYKKFKKEIKLPQDYIDKMCDSKFFKHFYTDSEISRIRDYWSHKSSS